MQSQIILQESFTNVQQAQAGLTKLFRQAEKNNQFLRVMRNDEALGVLIPDSLWLDWLEDLEALKSESYQRKIAQARKEPTKQLVLAKQLKASLGLWLASTDLPSKQLKILLGCHRLTKNEYYGSWTSLSVLVILSVMQKRWSTLNLVSIGFVLETTELSSM